MAEMTTKEALALAARHEQANRLVEAEQVYRAVLQSQPDEPDALHGLALLAFRTGHPAAAIDLMRRATRARPVWPAALCNLGVLLKMTGQYTDAITAYRAALAIDPGLADAHGNLADSLIATGDYDQAIIEARWCLSLTPSSWTGQLNLSVALGCVSRFDEALEAARHAVVLKPDSPEAHRQIGAALFDLGRLDESLVSFRQAIALNPHYAEACSNVGDVFRRQKKIDDAITWYEKAIAINPRLAAALSNLGGALQYAGRLDDAIATFRRAIEIAPGNVTLGSSLLYTMLFHPGFDAKAIRAEHDLWNQRYAASIPRLGPPSNDKNVERRLRVGYVSPNFSGQVVGRNLLPLFRHHDRDRFEIICYSAVRGADEITAEFRQLAHLWRDVTADSDDRLAQRIHDDGVDILVDLTLHMGGSRLLAFARQPAPVQVTFGGYPGTTGLETISYRLTDPHLDPPGTEADYSEKSVRLPNTFWCDDSRGDEPAVNAAPVLTNGFATFGSLNHFSKINDDVLQCWAEVLRQTPGSNLIMLAPVGSPRERVLGVMRSAGIESVRVEFVEHQPPAHYLRVYHRIDIGLDTWPYNGHSTSFDSFWMGVPVVTRAGGTVVGRAGISQLMNLQMSVLIAKSNDQFVQIAADLAKDSNRIAEIRNTLRQRIKSSPLCDGTNWSRGIERAYRQMWRDWCESKTVRP